MIILKVVVFFIWTAIVFVFGMLFAKRNPGAATTAAEEVATLKEMAKK
jgi:hypothetical protein